MIKHDLAAAGIDAVNAAGDVLDFHALRTTFCSSLNACGASPAVLGQLAQHSSPTTTLKHYARARLHDVQSALEVLPLSPVEGLEALRATGTGDLRPAANVAPASQTGRETAIQGSTESKKRSGF